MSVLTKSPRVTITGTIGTNAVVVLPSSGQREFLKIHNPSLTTYIAVTYDGTTTPVVNGAGTTIAPLWAETCDVQVPIGTVSLIGSAPGSPYTVEYS